MFLNNNKIIEMTEFLEYIQELQSEPIDKITEHSKRSALEILLKKIAEQKNEKIKILHEPRRIENFGSPDFLIYADNSIIGYIENKKIGENLDKILKTSQIKKYLELSDNILLTNYLEFVWLNIREIDKKKEIVIKRETLCSLEDLTTFKKLSNLNSEKVKQLIFNFLSQAPIGISSAKELSHAMAVRARNLKEFLFYELVRQDKENRKGKLFGLYRTFLTNVSSELTIEQFADAYAQMLVYGLFLAKLNADNQIITLRNAEEFVPRSFQLIRELVQFLRELERKEYIETHWIVEETLTIMNNLELKVITEELSMKFNPSSLITNHYSDPYIYFYEDFLSAYNQNLRKAKGVYYTPPQIVYFIISSINQILKTEFSINDGLADSKNVTALDFATGTGTFLVEIFKQVLSTFQSFENPQGLKNLMINKQVLSNPQGLKNLMIKEHLLKNIYGFEYLIAPYTITHLKLSQFLKENGYEMSADERLQVYLTNTIEPLEPKINEFVEYLSQEGEQAIKIKKQPILIITGNPPYSISSSNKNPETLRLLNVYKQGLNEQKINLDDDYIKFIRFAHEKVTKNGKGIIGIITNNSYLDGISHRRMRETLFNDFDKIYILNLHGNAIKNEGDQNVFDIRVGVSIILLIKNPASVLNFAKVETEVYYFSTKDNEIISREQKFQFLSLNEISTIPFTRIKPETPYFWFVNKTFTNGKYLKFWGVTDIFKNYSSAIQTKRDKITVHLDENSLKKVITDFQNLEVSEIRRKYELPADGRDWTILDAKNGLKNFSEKNITDYHYRPFFIQKTYFENKSRVFVAYPRYSVMQYFLKENIGLIFSRLWDNNKWTGCFITNYICDIHVIGGQSYIAPLYIYNKNQDGTLEDNKQPNFTENFKKFIKEKYLISTNNNADNIKINEKIKQEEKNKINIEKTLKSFVGQEDNIEIIDSLKNNLEEIKTKLENLKQQLQQSDNQNCEVPSPEKILGYIYAVLHSPTYREKYCEYLKIDFPKIPFVETLAKFETLAKLGNELIECHLMQKTDFKNEYNEFANFKGDGDRIVKKVEYKNEKIFINKENFFDNISKEIWNFEIGGRQILDNWLKARKERELNLNDVRTVKHIVQIIAFTIEQIPTIENLTKEWI